MISTLVISKGEPELDAALTGIAAQAVALEDLRSTATAQPTQALETR